MGFAESYKWYLILKTIVLDLSSNFIQSNYLDNLEYIEYSNSGNGKIKDLSSQSYWIEKRNKLFNKRKILSINFCEGT